MTNWNELIEENKTVVQNFADGNLSSTDFQRKFSGKTNPARSVIRSHGTKNARVLARKALRRRGIFS